MIPMPRQKLRLYASTILLLCALTALCIPLTLLSIPSLKDSPAVDGIAFVFLLGIFPLLTVAALVSSAIRFVRVRTPQALTEMLVAVSLIIIALMNGYP